MTTTEQADERWFGHNIAIEYSRIVTPLSEKPYLYVHCAPAWKETPEQFQARYTKVSSTEMMRLRAQGHTPAVEYTKRRPEYLDVPRDIFGGRLA